MLCCPDVTATEEIQLREEMAHLSTLLGDTRVRFRHGQTRFDSFQDLAEVDLEIRGALKQPPSPELQDDVRRLTARLRALDPH